MKFLYNLFDKKSFNRSFFTVLFFFTFLILLTGSNFSQSGEESSYFNNFVFHSSGSSCTHTPPATSFTAYLNQDQSKILIENAPRWDVGGDPNISGNGVFGVELGNFIDPPLQIGDSVFVRFTCNTTGEQGVIADSCTGIPWARFPLSLYLSQKNLPEPPQNVEMDIDSITGYRTVTWDVVSGINYTIYRRSYDETLPNGDPRMLYHRLAENLTSGVYEDQTTSLDNHYGYIIYAVNSEGIISSHSEEVNEDAPAGKDLTIGFIARLPRIDYVWGSENPDVEGWPAVEQEVTWQASVRNWWTEDLNVPYKWIFDGNPVDSGEVFIPAQSNATIDYPWNWTFDRHELKLVLDQNNEILEEEEYNNSLKIFTDAISVGFYVEQSVYDYFREYQHELGVHSNCWEDWAQRHVRRWNEMLAEAIYPDTPEGVLDRIRIDDIHVVEDEALPLAGGLPTNHPNLNDRTIDLQWGFPATLLDGTFYSDHDSPTDGNPFYFEGSLFHELGHARYLIDVYGFNVSPEGVNIMENGEPVAGTPMMPLHGGLVYSTPLRGLMNGQYTFMDPYSAPAMNLIAGHRAVMGNYNAPENIGVFLQDLPVENSVTITDTSGNIIADASVELYQATGNSGVWYGKTYDDEPDHLYTTNTEGQIEVGTCPFDDDGVLDHTLGISNVIAILRVEKDELVGYTFLEASSFNLEFWRGNVDHGNHVVEVNLVDPTVGVEEEITGITDYKLEQNYPNPFNPSTTILYQIPESGNVIIKIYDLMGQEVSTLVDNFKSSGKYQVAWNGKNNSGIDVSSGIYFYSLKINNHNFIKKMTLVR